MEPERGISYSPELGERICTALAGGKYLIEICEADDMPAWRTVYIWLHRYPEFKKLHEEATAFRSDIADLICAEIADGKSVRSICRQKGMPHRVTVFRWLRESPEFQKQYTLATEARSDALVEDTLDIADDGSNDWMDDNDPENPGYRFNGEHFQRSRLRVDIRKWNAARMKPKKYGEKLDIAHSGSIETISRESLIERLTSIYATAVSRIDGSGAEGTAGSDAGVPTTH